MLTAFQQGVKAMTGNKVLQHHSSIAQEVIGAMLGAVLGAAIMIAIAMALVDQIIFV